jgi:hypothetical protein
MSRLGQSAVLLTLCLAVTNTGCGKIREIRACRGLSQDVNPVLDQIEALSKSRAEGRELLMAKQYAALAKLLAPRGVGDTALAGAVRDYANVLASTDGALRAHAEAVKSNNNSRITETRRELERLVKRERAAVARIALECKA